MLKSEGVKVVDCTSREGGHDDAKVAGDFETTSAAPLTRRKDNSGGTDRSSYCDAAKPYDPGASQRFLDGSSPGRREIDGHGSRCPWQSLGNWSRYGDRETDETDSDKRDRHCHALAEPLELSPGV